MYTLPAVSMAMPAGVFRVASTAWLPSPLLLAMPLPAIVVMRLKRVTTDSWLGKQVAACLERGETEDEAARERRR